MLENGGDETERACGRDKRERERERKAVGCDADEFTNCFLVNCNLPLIVFTASRKPGFMRRLVTPFLLSSVTNSSFDSPGPVCKFIAE